MSLSRQGLKKGIIASFLWWCVLGRLLGCISHMGYISESHRELTAKGRRESNIIGITLIISGVALGVVSYLSVVTKEKKKLLKEQKDMDTEDGRGLQSH